MRANSIKAWKVGVCLPNYTNEILILGRGRYDRHSKQIRADSSESPNITAKVERAPSLPVSGEKEYADSFRHHATSSISAQHDGDVTMESPTTPLFHTTTSSTPQANPTSRADSTVFLGESSSISLVHTTQDTSSTGNSTPRDQRLRYPIPDAISFASSSSAFETKRRAARNEYLTENGAFSFPPNDVCEVLLEAYFSWFHPCYPILDRRSFFASYVTKTLSPLLFQAVLFIGMTHSNEKVMKSLGYTDRQEARNAAYNHAKDLYDADWETDKVVVCQALFLMSFWRAGPLLEKDSRHWLAATVNLAQTKGMHR